MPPGSGCFSGLKRPLGTRVAAIQALVASHTFPLGDLQTDEEFNQLLNGFAPARQEEPALLFQASAAVKTPAEVDWRAKGYVTPVKNQVGMGWGAGQGWVSGQQKQAAASPKNQKKPPLGNPEKQLLWFWLLRFCS